MTRTSRRFTHRNESFECVNCGAKVKPATGSCRNHCPHCLHSVHLDMFPGDRQADCGGLMKPIAVEYHTKKGYQIVHRCSQCGHEARNVANLDDRIQPDSLDELLAIMRRAAERS